jgi:hypothetical protein
VIHVLAECRCGAVREVALAGPCQECGADALEIRFCGPDEERAQLTLEEPDAENPLPDVVENPNPPGKSGVPRDPHLYVATDPAGRIVLRRRRSKFTIEVQARYELGGRMSEGGELMKKGSMVGYWLELPLALARFLANALPAAVADFDEQEALRKAERKPDDE